MEDRIDEATCLRVDAARSGLSPFAFVVAWVPRRMREIMASIGRALAVKVGGTQIVADVRNWVSAAGDGDLENQGGADSYEIWTQASAACDGSSRDQGCMFPKCRGWALWDCFKKQEAVSVDCGVESVTCPCFTWKWILSVFFVRYNFALGSGIYW